MKRMKIKTNDNVLVTTGKNKGKTGAVLRVNSVKNQIVVEKINIRTKHIRKTASAAGDRVKLETPISVSNVMLICPHCSKVTRVGYKTSKKEKKVRVCKKCNAVVDLLFKKKKVK